MRIIIFIILLCINLLHIKAQVEERVVEGCIISQDSSNYKKALPYATVSVWELPDSNFVKGGTTNNCGNFLIKYKVNKSTKAFLKISYLGMHDNIYILSNYQQEDVDTIILLDRDFQLDEISVLATKPQIIQKKDTTIIDTEAFKIPLNSYLNEFLSRIPGLVYNKNTNSLKYNGRPIQSIRLNGKPFFDGNIQTVLERLPTFYIDKINIYQSKKNDDSYSRSDNLFILDLKTKAAFNGAFLNSIEGGYGSNNKQYINIQTNYFEENGTNLSFFAERSNKELYNKYDGNMSHNVGINGHKQINKQVTIAGSINYNNIINGAYSEKYEEQYLNPTNFYSFTKNENSNKTNKLNYRTFIDWKPSNKTSFLFDLGYDYSSNYSFSNNQTLTLNRYSDLLKYDWQEISDSIKLNKNTLNSTSEYKSHNFQLTNKWIQKISDKIDSEVTIDYNHIVFKGKDKSNSTIFYHTLDSLYNKEQVAMIPNNRFEISTSFNFIYKLKDNLLIEPYYSINYNNENLVRDVYYLDNKENKSTTYIDSLSYKTKSNSTMHNFGLNIQYKLTNWEIKSKLQYSPLRRNIIQSYFDNQADTILKNCDVKYDLKSTWSKNNIYISLYYEGYTSQPELGMMLSTKNTNNPLNVYKGNPLLKRTFLHSISGYVSGIFGLSTNVNFNIKSNDITEHILYNSRTGYKEITPININGNWDFNSSISWNKTHKSFTYSAYNNIFYNNKRLLINEISSNDTYNSITKDLGVNVKGQISFRPSWGNIDFFGEYSLYQSINSLEQNKMSIMNYKVGLNNVIDIFRNLQFNSNFSYLYRYGDNIDTSLKSEILWNIDLIYKPFKKGNLIFTFSWIDIFSQRKNFVINSTAEKKYEYKTNQVPTFILLSLKYSFEFNKAKK